jgi:hypothetical protein
MVNSKVVQKALKQTLALEKKPGSKTNYSANGQSSIISRLIYDIFGGEILKTRMEKGWHFYNRIDGELIDFTRSEMNKSSADNSLEEVPSPPDETYNYFAQEDYTIFLTRFIGAFEETVGLNKYREDLRA